jgi:hypothetical protein
MSLYGVNEYIDYKKGNKICHGFNQQTCLNIVDMINDKADEHENLLKKYGNVDMPHLNKHAMNYIKENRNHINNQIFVLYRNLIAHLNVIRNANTYINDIGKFDSYFQLYHYIMQRKLIASLNKKENLDLVSDYNKKIEYHKTYCKDFTWALNVGFAYSLSRYKVLSIDDLFDKNRKAEKDKNKQKNG